MTDIEINIAINELCNTRTLDYANVLDAMHYAESTLSFAKQRRYGRALKEVLDDCIGSPDHDRHATARQRTEAFIRTFGTWKGGK